MVSLISVKVLYSKNDAKIKIVFYHHHYIQYIVFIENYNLSLGRERRQQFMPIKDNTTKESSTQESFSEREAWVITIILVKKTYLLFQ